MDLGRELAQLSARLRAAGIAHLVIGGVALAAYGFARTTLDLDFAIDGDRQDDVVALLEADGFATLHRSRGFSNHLHPQRGRVDVVYVRDATREAMFAAARAARIGEGVEAGVPSPEHLAALKAHAIAHDPTRTFQDLADVRSLLTLPGVDRDAVRATFRRAGIESRFDELLATLP